MARIKNEKEGAPGKGSGVMPRRIEERFHTPKNVRTMVLGAKAELRKIMKAESPTAIEAVDPFSATYSTGLILEPPLPMSVLVEMPALSTILPQCINAMVTNIDGFGHEFDYTAEPADIDPETFQPVEGTGETRKEVIAEKEMLKQFFSTINPWDSWSNIRRKMRYDYELIGNAYLELIRSVDKKLSIVQHVIGHTVRMTPLDPLPTTVQVTVFRNGKEIPVNMQRRFRRYVQNIGTKSVFFKEYGDPRTISKLTGDVDETLSTDMQANEILHIRQYYPNSSYGLPRWIGSLISVYGARKAEELNYTYFRNGTIPPAIITISGGGMTQESYDYLKDYWSEETSGVERMHKPIIIEAVPTDVEVGREGVVRIDVKPLTDARLKDALFQGYDANSRKKVRSIFRLAPMFTGETEDLTRATAEASRGVTEEQVFVPERRDFDFWINNTILKELDVQFHEFRTKGPELGDSTVVVEAIRAFNQAGALTGNIARTLMKEVIGIETPRIAEPYGDIPFLVAIELAKKGDLLGIQRATLSGTGLLKPAPDAGDAAGSPNGSAGALAASGIVQGAPVTAQSAPAAKDDEKVP